MAALNSSMVVAENRLSLIYPVSLSSMYEASRLLMGILSRITVKSSKPLTFFRRIFSWTEVPFSPSAD